ncbi:MAG: rhodanese [Saprospirales bacterium]|nr:rhodanese [Saprospirales bacterium]
MFNLFKTASRNAAYTNLSPNEFISKLNKTQDAVILDVRTPAEFQSGALDNAINIDFFSPTFQQRLGMLDKSKSYFVYCRSGNRSAQACKIMNSLGFSKLYNMAGGLMELDY